MFSNNNNKKQPNMPNERRFNESCFFYLVDSLENSKNFLFHFNHIWLKMSFAILQKPRKTIMQTVDVYWLFSLIAAADGERKRDTYRIDHTTKLKWMTINHLNGNGK